MYNGFVIQELGEGKLQKKLVGVIQNELQNVWQRQRGILNYYEL